MNQQRQAWLTGADGLEIAFSQAFKLRGWKQLLALYRISRYYGVPQALTRKLFELWLSEKLRGEQE